jgi:hypothetical protein
MYERISQRRGHVGHVERGVRTNVEMVGHSQACVIGATDDVDRPLHVGVGYKRMQSAHPEETRTESTSFSTSSKL